MVTVLVLRPFYITFYILLGKVISSFHLVVDSFKRKWDYSALIVGNGESCRSTVIYRVHTAMHSSKWKTKEKAEKIADSETVADI